MVPLLLLLLLLSLLYTGLVSFTEVGRLFMVFDPRVDDVYLLLCDLVLESEPEYDLLLRPSMTTSSIVSIMSTAYIMHSWSEALVS
jgi:hypothetical protein